MALGECSICSENQSKYKCPKCPIQYCSLSCFKSPKHKHDASVGEIESDKTTKKINNQVSNDNNINKRYLKLLDDKELAYMLSFKSLQYHLKSIYDILIDSNLNNEKRYEMANKKLSDLRSSGIQENSLVEEFCQKITLLLNNQNEVST